MIRCVDPLTKELGNVFEMFIKEIEKNSFEKISDFVSKDVIADISMFGKTEGLFELTERLKWKGPTISHKMFMITNPVIRYDGEKAHMGAIVIALLGNGENENLHIFTFGGRASIGFKKEERWKIGEILYDLEWQNGNTAFPENWNMIDYDKYGGHKLSIISELDSPWVRIPVAKNQYTEEELLVDGYHRYAWAQDCADGQLALSSFTDDIRAEMPHGVFINKKDFAYHLKFLAHKEHKLQHAGRVHSFNIDGERAYLEIYRIEPHRLGTKTLNANNFYQPIYTGRHEYDMRKEDGLWKIAKMKYIGKVFSVEEERNSLYVDNAREIN